MKLVFLQEGSRVGASDLWLKKITSESGAKVTFEPDPPMWTVEARIDPRDPDNADFDLEVVPDHLPLSSVRVYTELEPSKGAVHKLVARWGPGLVPAAPGVRVLNQVPDGMPIPNLDKEQFRQVLVNLVQNAVEAMPAGHPGQVAVLAQGGGAEPWRILVSDDGAGIAPEALAKIFLPFFTTKTKGTGLGLSVSQGIIAKHGGRMLLDSQEGRGSVLTVILPVTTIS